MSKQVITATLLRELLSYDPGTGVFTWRWRSIAHCKSEKDQARWNNRHAGKVAGATNKDGYIRIGLRGASIKSDVMAHRLAWLYMTGEWPKNEIDHINGVTGDNSWRNLRDANRSTNAQNVRKCLSNNKSTGLLGAYPNGSKFKSLKWVAGRAVYLGNFDTPEQAHSQYLIAKRKHHEGCTI